MKTIDFTDCKKVFGKAYNGANGKKIAVEYEGNEYMLKFPPSAEKKPTDLSYTNSCISEYLGSHIFNMLGIKAQDTLLGTFMVSGKVKVVCACRDFTADGSVFYDFCSIKNTIIDSEHNGNGTELDDIMESIEKQTFVNPKMLSDYFWDVFVVDALLGNFDRHNGNWGFLVNRDTGACEIAPVFDCGSCLLPQADEKVMKLVIENEAELNTRVYNFPTSAVKLNNQKINYYKFIESMENEDLNEAIQRIVPKVDMDEISALIDNTPYISVTQKQFYKTYIGARFDKILVPVFEQLMDEQTSDFGMKM